MFLEFKIAIMFLTSSSKYKGTIFFIFIVTPAFKNFSTEDLTQEISTAEINYKRRGKIQFNQSKSTPVGIIILPPSGSYRSLIFKRKLSQPEIQNIDFITLNGQRRLIDFR